MANTFTPPYPQTIKNISGQILPADTTTKKTVYTAGSQGSIVKSWGVVSTDTTARTVDFYINVGGAGTDQLLCTITIPITAGNDAATAPVDVLRNSLFTYTSYDAFGNKVLYLQASTTLKVASRVTVTTAKEIDFNGEVLDY
jgi:hypothetical protein